MPGLNKIKVEADNDPHHEARMEALRQENIRLVRLRQEEERLLAIETQRRDRILRELAERQRLRDRLNNGGGANG